MLRAIAIVVILLAASSQADSPEPLSLEEAQRLALARSPLMSAANYGIDALEEQYREAWWSWFPTLNLNFLTTAIPPQPEGQTNDLLVFGPNGQATGDTVPQGPDLGQWNAWLKLDVTAHMPIYTFGKLAALRKMAAAGVDVGQAARRQVVAELTYQVARAWYTLALGRQLDDLIKEGEDQLRKARERLERLEAEDSVEYDQDDMFRLRIYEAQVRKVVLDNRRLAEMARTGLRVALAMEEGKKLDLPGEMELEPVEVDLGGLQCYVRAAADDRPEIQIKRHTIEVREGQVDQRFAEFFPDLFIAGSFTYAHTAPFDGSGRPEEQAQNSIFSGAVFDALGGGVAVGLRLGLDYIQKTARFRKAQAEMMQAQAELDGELSKLRIEIEQVWRQARDQDELRELQYRAMRAARALLTSKAHLYEDGLDPPPFRDVLDAAVTHLRQKSEWLQSVHGFNVSVAQLSRVVGTDITRLQCPEIPEGGP